MAEAREVASLDGYDDEFVNSVDEDLHCSICHLPLKEAVQTGKCGHRFCRQCLDEHFRRLVILLMINYLMMMMMMMIPLLKCQNCNSGI